MQPFLPDCRVLTLFFLHLGEGANVFSIWHFSFSSGKSNRQQAAVASRQSAVSTCHRLLTGLSDYPAAVCLLRVWEMMLSAPPLCLCQVKMKITFFLEVSPHLAIYLSIHTRLLVCLFCLHLHALRAVGVFRVLPTLNPFPPFQALSSQPSVCLM